MAKIGDLQISSPGTYEDGFFRIEEYNYFNNEGPMWATPAWEERGMPHWQGPFKTFAEAKEAFANE